MYMLTNLAEPQDAGDCSGWERDPQSFSKRVADHYLRTVLGLSLMARSIRPPGPGSVRWEVLYPNNIVIAVIFAKGFVAAARIHPWGPIRHYNYSCTPQGDLVLSERPLPSSGVSLSLGEPPRLRGCRRNPIDARAAAIIAAAQNQSQAIDVRGRELVRAICRTYFPTEAGKVSGVQFIEHLSGLETQSEGAGATARGLIRVGRYFVENTDDQLFARRVLQVGHELRHIDQWRAGMVGPAKKAEREFLAHFWGATTPELPGTGCMPHATRVNVIDAALGNFNCLTAPDRARYAQQQATLLRLRLQEQRASGHAATQPPAACVLSH